MKREKVKEVAAIICFFLLVLALLSVVYFKLKFIFKF